jgi:hypothetical protein
MKRAVLAVAIAATTFLSVAPTFAAEHHQVCHKVKVHAHWQKRCH